METPIFTQIEIAGVLEVNVNAVFAWKKNAFQRRTRQKRD